MINPIVIAIDAMGGDNSPTKVIEGVSIHLRNSVNVNYKIFGKEDLINPLLKKYSIPNERFNLIHTDKVVEGEDSALTAAKRGKNTSLWLAVESLKNDEAHAMVSAGNTGALFLISKLNLKMIENIDKPALSALWPSKKGMNVVLDLGANIECNSKNLIDFSIMGSALHKALFDKEKPCVALLNIGSEELKGNAMIKSTYQILSEKKYNLFDFKGYIEGNHIMDGDVNVIVADGFTGNIALKTAEGTSNFIISELKQALSSTIIGKFSSFINYNNLKKFKNKLDPRLYNGAILLGLNKPVIKSHGSTDSVGFANSLKVCEQTIKGRLIEQITANINQVKRINLTKKDIINSIYMQIGFSKKISETLLEDIFELIIKNIIKHKKVKIAKFGTFTLRNKKERAGRNPKTKEPAIIASRNVILFKASKEFKEYINKND